MTWLLTSRALLLPILALVATAGCSSSSEGEGASPNRGLFDVPRTSTTSSSLYGVWEAEGLGDATMVRLELRPDRVRRTVLCGVGTYVDLSSRARVSSDRIELLEDAADSVRFSDSTGDRTCWTVLPMASLGACKTPPTKPAESCFVQNAEGLTLALPDAKERASELNVWKKIGD